MDFSIPAKSWHKVCLSEDEFFETKIKINMKGQ